MKMKRTLVIPLFAMVFSSCFHSKQTPVQAKAMSDTLTYSFKYVKERSTGCGTLPDDSCCIGQCSYPVFDSKKELNDAIIDKILSSLSVGDTASKNIQQLEKNFLNESGIRDPKHPDYIRYSLNIHVDSVKQINGLITMEIHGDTYWYDTHTGEETRVFPINWDVKKNKLITLDDIFKEGYKKRLYDMAAYVFIRGDDIRDTAYLPDNFKIGSKVFPLNDAFLITPLGINFLFNPGQIGGSGDTQHELLIPYDKISTLLRSNTIVQQYLK